MRNICEIPGVFTVLSIFWIIILVSAYSFAVGKTDYYFFVDKDLFQISVCQLTKFDG